MHISNDYDLVASVGGMDMCNVSLSIYSPSFIALEMAVLIHTGKAGISFNSSGNITVFDRDLFSFLVLVFLVFLFFWGLMFFYNFLNFFWFFPMEGLNRSIIVVVVIIVKGGGGGGLG